MLPVFVDEKKYLISKPETHNSQPETEKFQKYLGKVTIFKSSGEVKPFVPGGKCPLIFGSIFFLLFSSFRKKLYTKGLAN
jgi:hypothetical protein